MTRDDVQSIEQMVSELSDLRNEDQFVPSAQALSAYNHGQLKALLEQAYWSVFGLLSFLEHGGGRDEIEEERAA